MRIELPQSWEPRHYQGPLWRYLENGGRRAIAIWHRRAGKDEVCLHRTACAMMERPATYWHMLPAYAQARKAIWTAINPRTGRRRIDEAFPHELRAATNEQEMFIRLRNEATWQCVGSDRYDAVVGAPPVGLTFSEWALSNPAAWAYLAPIVEENSGWAVFITTSRGRNHAKSMLDHGRKTPSWFHQVLTVNDTGAIPMSAVERARAEYHGLFGEEAGDALIEQEYFCSFDAAVLGSYWGKEMRQAEQEGRIGKVDVQRDLPVHTAWDIGVDDAMAIWAFQVFPDRIHVVDYVEGHGYGFDHYAQWLDDRGYHGTDWVPHDAKIREPGTPGARTRIESMVLLGRKPALVANLRLMDGINAARKTIPRAWFDEERCAKGLECLREYRVEYDDEAHAFLKTPAHDWACVVAETLVLTRRGACPISALPGTGEVLTPWGWKAYRNPHMTRKNAQLVAVSFADGLTVKCTADHLFLTESGWTYAGRLRAGSVIRSSLTQTFNISKGSFTGRFRHRNGTIAPAPSIFIGKCGERFLAMFRRAVRYITATKTLLTTPLRISNVSTSPSINLILGGVSERRVSRPSYLSERAQRPLSGTNPKQEESGIDDKRSGRSRGRNGGASLGLASIAARYLTALCGKMAIRRSSVATAAKPLRIVSVNELNETADVWCLTVDDGHCWSLANGAVVHNSHGADAWRYLSLGWRPPLQIKPQEARPRDTPLERITYAELEDMDRRANMRERV